MITPIAEYSNNSKVLPYRIAFKGNYHKVTSVKNASFYEIFKDAAVAVKRSEFIPFFKFVASMFGKELVYNDETGKLNAIKKFKKGILQEVKHFYPNGRKLSTVDEYTEGKLSKITAFCPDGKTLDWTVEYRGKDDVTIFYHPDGKTIKTAQTELNDGTGRMQIKQFDPNFRWLSMENYKNEVLTDMELYYDDRKVSRTYKDGKLSRQITNFRWTPVKSFIPEGDQRKNPIHSYVTDFDKDGTPVETTIHGIKSNGELYIMGRMTYPDKDNIKLTRFKEDGKELYIEMINKRTGKRIVTYSKE